MKRKSVGLSELARMPRSEQDRTIAELLAECRRPIDEADRENCWLAQAQFLQQYGFPLTEIHERIDDGAVQETLDICRWCMDLAMFRQIGLML